MKLYAKMAIFCQTIFLPLFVNAQTQVPENSSSPIYYNGSKVGIGASDPATTLEVRGRTNPSFRLTETTTNGYFEIGNPTTNGAFAPYAKIGECVLQKHGTKNNIHFYQGNTRNDGSMAFTFGDSSNGRVLNIFNNGKVTIGTNDPHLDAKLAVNGKIVASEIKAFDFQGADYVFLPDYQLLSLGDVEKFINENNHLPDVPSADEMFQEGVDLVDMNRILLQKIEELTLYIIDQNKQVEINNEYLNQLKTLLKNHKEEK